MSARTEKKHAASKHALKPRELARRRAWLAEKIQEAEAAFDASALMLDEADRARARRAHFRGWMYGEADLRLEEP